MNWSYKIIRAFIIGCFMMSLIYIAVYTRIGEDALCRKNFRTNIPRSIQRELNTIIDSMDRQRKTTSRPFNELNASRNISLMTLFTSWRDRKEKEIVIRNTIENWETFHPNISTIVFANSVKSSHHFAREHGWAVLQSKTATNESIPLLKDMFTKAKSHKSSIFYCYANSDMLFTSSLMQTLMKIKSFKQDVGAPILIVGQRTDISIVNMSSSNNFSYILSRGLQEGETHAPDAIDYLIISQDFPLKDLPDVVIGRIAYDNYFIMHARAHRVAVVDSTETNPAIHQTTRAGNTEGHKHRNMMYNRELLEKELNITTFESGLTTCSNYVTTFNSTTHEVNILRKTSKPDSCMKMFTSW